LIRFITIIKPRYIIAITLGVALLMFTSAFIELRQSREELFHVLQEHSLSLAETITNSSTNIVLSTDRIEDQLSRRLLNNAHFIATLDSIGVLNKKMLREIAIRNDIYRINIFNRRGERILSSHTHEKHAGQMREKNSPAIVLKPILSGKADEIVIGIKEARFEEGQRYAVAVKRTGKAGGAIVLNLDAATFIEFRKQIGIGKLVSDLGNNTGIEYVVIQDRDGILAATKDVKEMTTVENDPSLLAVLERDTTVSREMLFHQRATFEILKRFSIDGAAVGVLRIGLSLDELRAIDERMQRRMLTMTVVFIFLGVIIVSFIVASQNIKLISGKYASIQTLTGNILEHMNDAVVSIDHSGKITIFNRQAETLFGLGAAEVIGHSIDQLPGKVRECLHSMTEQKEEQTERTLLCAKDEERIVSISTSTTTDPHGGMESRTMVIKDLTDAKRLEKEVQRKEKMTAMGELAAGVAHEIRNPLNAISMIAQRYEKEFSPKKGVREYKGLTAVLKSESIRINGIVQQFLKYARPKTIKVESVSSQAFIGHVATLFQAQASAKKIHFTFESDDAAFSIDHDQMTQAILNLLQNALDATPKQGSITLTLKAGNKEVIIEVADTGSGVPAELQEKIFNLYFTTKTTGTGMGLAITQQIISQHNGSLFISANRPTGSIFTIILPV
jgi:PAS domain S-box-containing protein